MTSRCFISALLTPAPRDPPLQVTGSEADTLAPLTPPPAAVLTPDAFAALCAAPPLQGSMASGLLPRTFKPLDMAKEAPSKGMIVALDAEFVALSPPETTFEAGQEVQLRRSRCACMPGDVETKGLHATGTQ